MDAADLVGALGTAGLGRIAPRLAALAQPAIRLTALPTSEETLAGGVSRLGGVPDLPVGVAWPYWKGAPLAFLTQIRLEDAPAYDAKQALPERGLLSFFYDARQQTYGDTPADRGSWQVLYLDGDETWLQRASVPPGMPASGRFTPCAVAFSAELTLPQQPELDLPDLDWSADERALYERFLATFPTPQEHAAMHHRLLGYPETLQDDMRMECQVAAHGLTGDDPRAAGLAEGAKNWRLLLQLDSDAGAGMRWGDAGMVYFWIERDALAEKRFDNVWLVLQSD